MPKAYWIAHVTITNPERYKDYITLNAAAFKKYNARFIVRGGQHEILVRAWTPRPRRSRRTRRRCGTPRAT